MEVLATAENLLVAVALFIVAGVAALAVFHPSFEDTLVQRAALSFVSIGALAASNSALRDGLPAGFDLTAIAAAVYAVESFRINAMRWHSRGHHETRSN